MNEPIKNKVAESGLVTIDLEEYYPKGEIMVFDLKDYLFKGLIVKEKEFRESVKNLNTEIYRNNYVAITCTSEAIIPMWAYMLVASNLQPVARDIFFGAATDLRKAILLKNIASLQGENYEDQRVVIKGCGDVAIPEAAYIEITQKLRPFARSIMFGEACSTVPVYKKSKP